MKHIKKKITTWDKLRNYFLFRICILHTCCVVMTVCFAIFLFCLHICVCVWLPVQGPLRKYPNYIRSLWTNKYINSTIRKNWIIVPRECSSSMIRFSWCVFCSMSLLIDYTCMHLPFIPWSIAGVPSSQALPGFLITAPPPVLVPAVLGALTVWIQNQNKNKQKGPNLLSHLDCGSSWIVKTLFVWKLSNTCIRIWICVTTFSDFLNFQDHLRWKKCDEGVRWRIAWVLGLCSRAARI